MDGERTVLQAASDAAVEAVNREARASAARIIQRHLDDAATVEHWLYCYPDWVQELGDTERGLKAVQARETPTAVRRVQKPTEQEAVHLADIARKAAVIERTLDELEEAPRAAVETYYFARIGGVRRRNRNAAIATLVEAFVREGLLRDSVDRRGAI